MRILTALLVFALTACALPRTPELGPLITLQIQVLHNDQPLAQQQLKFCDDDHCDTEIYSTQADGRVVTRRGFPSLAEVPGSINVRRHRLCLKDAQGWRPIWALVTGQLPEEVRLTCDTAKPGCDARWGAATRPEHYINPLPSDTTACLL